MSADARLLHLELISASTSLDAGGQHYREFRGFAILAVQPNARYSNADEIVRVLFHKAPDGRIENGALVVESVELAAWSKVRKSKDEDGSPVDESVFLAALKRDVPAELKRTSARFIEMLESLFHIAVAPRVVEQLGQKPPSQPVVCGAPNVPLAYAFGNWDEVAAAAAATKGRIEACYECKARLSK
jgi:hypothetical protein